MKITVVTRPKCQSSYSGYIQIGDHRIDGREVDNAYGSMHNIDEIVHALELAGHEIEYREEAEPKYVQIKHTTQHQLCMIDKYMKGKFWSLFPFRQARITNIEIDTKNAKSTNLSKGIEFTNE